jgi:hypothetical protein
MVEEDVCIACADAHHVGRTARIVGDADVTQPGCIGQRNLFARCHREIVARDDDTIGGAAGQQRKSGQCSDAEHGDSGSGDCRQG